MAVSERWATRYQFLQEVWNGRARLVLDADLERALHVGPAGVGRDAPPMLVELIDALLPRHRDRDSVCMVAHNERRVAELARRRPGTTFAGLADAAEVAADEPWQVATVDLGGLVAAEPGYEVASRLDAGTLAFLEVLAERVEDGGRAVVVSAPSAESSGDDGLDFEDFAELVESQIGEARFFGISRPTMGAVFDLTDTADEEVAIDYDNSLGDEEPRFAGWIAAIGVPEALLGDGLTLLELPSAEDAQPTDSARRSSQPEGARVQLAEAQRQADLAAIERQRLMEALNEANERVDELEDALDAAGSEPRAVVASDGKRLDAALAREQALRWQLEQTRAELEQARARPVTEMEAHVAELEARLAAAAATVAPRVEAPTGPALRANSKHGADAAPSVRAEIDKLLRRIERGGMPALQLHETLSRLRRRLAR